ncbi:NADH-ubiquinone oxidoreductase [Trifolium repens]|nr:NADH-ubiquinone oxidoreductase [Trifolium repens]
MSVAGCSYEESLSHMLFECPVFGKVWVIFSFGWVHSFLAFNLAARIVQFSGSFNIELQSSPFIQPSNPVTDRCAKTKEMWIYPLRPYEFWTFKRHILRKGESENQF